jgi:hypothetical protein
MCKQQKYKGLIIYYNKDGSPFDTPYISIANPHITYPDGSNPHCHVTSEGLAKQIIDCFHLLRKYGSAEKYQRNIRNKACRLMGLYIKSS